MPLETLPGWPAAPPATVPHMLMVLFGFPLIVIAIVVIIGVIRPAKSSYDSMQERQALWVGSNATEALTEAQRDDTAAIAKGGASARW